MILKTSNCGEDFVIPIFETNESRHQVDNQVNLDVRPYLSEDFISTTICAEVKIAGVAKSIGLASNYLTSSNNITKGLIYRDFMLYYNKLLDSNSLIVDSIAKEVIEKVKDAKEFKKCQEDCIKVLCLKPEDEEPNYMKMDTVMQNLSYSSTSGPSYKSNIVTKAKEEYGLKESVFNLANVDDLKEFIAYAAMYCFAYRNNLSFKGIRDATVRQFAFGVDHKAAKVALVMFGLIIKKLTIALQHKASKINDAFLNIKKNQQAVDLDFYNIVNNRTTIDRNGLKGKKEYYCVTALADFHKSKAYYYKSPDGKRRTGRAIDINKINEKDYLVVLKDVQSKVNVNVLSEDIIEENNNISVHNTVSARKNKNKVLQEKFKIGLNEGKTMTDIVKMIFLNNPTELIKKPILFKINFPNVNDAYLLFYHRNGAREEFPLALILAEDMRTVIGVVPMTIPRESTHKEAFTIAHKEIKKELKGKKDYTSISYVNGMYNHLMGETIREAVCVSNIPERDSHRGYIKCCYEMYTLKTRPEHKINIHGVKNIKLNVTEAYTYCGETDFQWFNWEVFGGLNEIIIEDERKRNAWSSNYAVENIFNDLKYFELPVNGTLLYQDMLGGACKEGTLSALAAVGANTADFKLLPVPLFYAMFSFLYLTESTSMFNSYILKAEELKNISRGKKDVTDIELDFLWSDYFYNTRTGALIMDADGMQKFLHRYMPNFNSKLQFSSKSKNDFFKRKDISPNERSAIGIGSDFIKFHDYKEKASDIFQFETKNSFFFIKEMSPEENGIKSYSYHNYSSNMPFVDFTRSGVDAYRNSDSSIISPRNSFNLPYMLAMYPSYKNSSKEELFDMAKKHLKKVGDKMREGFKHFDNPNFFDDFQGKNSIFNKDMINADNAELLNLLK